MNKGIRVPQVRTIDEAGKQVGVLPIEEALRLAQERSLDLVEVAPQAQPPVCRIMDYGKYRYEQTKKEKVAKKHQQAVKIKEIKLHPRIDPHDLTFKEKHAREFLEKGHKVKITVQFKGRELSHIEFGQQLLTDILNAVSDVGAMEMRPRLQSRRLSMVVGPLKGKPAASPHPAAPAEPAPTSE
ncbi:MAG: translation initiation factor IF-3 [Verrucomicrobia bacterium]|nr:translation initiation factor IF-3 [Verrucomicrobiota bacterium]